MLTSSSLAHLGPDLGPVHVPERIKLNFKLDLSKQDRMCTIMVPGDTSRQFDWEDINLPKEESLLQYLAQHNLSHVQSVQVDAHRCGDEAPNPPALVEVLVPLLGIYEVVLTAAGGDGLRDAIRQAFEYAVHQKFPSLELTWKVESGRRGDSYAYVLSSRTTEETECE